MSASIKLRLNNTTLTKQEQEELLRQALPACQPQEGTPPNTFTQSELDALKTAMPAIEIGESQKKPLNTNKLDIRDFSKGEAPQDGADDTAADVKAQGVPEPATPELDWFGAPRFRKDAHLAREFREKVRAGLFKGPTNAVCPGFLQCNLVVLPAGQYANDFLLFCQRNPQACPLVEVCDVGSPHPIGIAQGADLRTDVPKYAVYRDGKFDKEVEDVTDIWPENSVAFLIGCTFSYDGALMEAGIPLKAAEQGKNVAMYNTSLKCRSAGSLKGNLVVSMKPIPALKVSRHVEITSKYLHAHGGPVSVGSGEALGIYDLNKVDYGDAIEVAPDEVPVFHACGVTPQNILMQSNVPFAITHSAGHMFVADMPDDMAR